MMIIFAFDSMYQLRQKETNLPHGMLMMVDECPVYERSFKNVQGFSPDLADDRQKIDRDFSTLWLEKRPSILSTTTTDLEFTLNDC